MEPSIEQLAAAYCKLNDNKRCLFPRGDVPTSEWLAMRAYLPQERARVKHWYNGGWELATEKNTWLGPAEFKEQILSYDGGLSWEYDFSTGAFEVTFYNAGFTGSWVTPERYFKFTLALSHPLIVLLLTERLKAWLRRHVAREYEKERDAAERAELNRRFDNLFTGT